VRYLERHPVYVSAVTVIERLNGYNLALKKASERSRDILNQRRASYVGHPSRVLVLDVAVAAAAAELLAPRA
jgi:hypothetical protein